MMIELPEPHWAVNYQGLLPEGAYSADQVRQAVAAAMERAAKRVESAVILNDWDQQQLAAAIRAEMSKETL
jgi:nitrate reductase beta subunit